MNVRRVTYLIAYMLIVLSIGIGVSWIVSWFHNDPATAKRGLAYSGLIVGGLGLVLVFLTRASNIDLSRRDGFGIVTFGWLAATAAGSLPYLLAGIIHNPVPAMFETMSGLTTTGASVLSNLESIPKGILFWRGLTHWFGGMGVLVLCVAILPFLGVGGMQIFRAEVPGPSKDRLTPRIETTAKLLWGVYFLFTLILAWLLWMGNMSWLDAFCHSFATMATGGFSTRSASVAAYDSVYIEVVIIVFMFIAGTNFALHYQACCGKLKVYVTDPEFRAYFGFLFSACMLIALNLWFCDPKYTSIWHALRASFFTATSIMTTTGFCTDDFDLWPHFSRLVLVMLMFLGGCAGSTGGGIKVVRVFVMIKETIKEIRRFMQPHVVFTIKLGRQPMNADAISHIAAFFMIFVMIFGVITVIMTFYTDDVETAFSSVIATMGNIGPGLAGVGATNNYAGIPAVGQAILILCMLLGRLELYTVLIVFLPGFWKK